MFEQSSYVLEYCNSIRNKLGYKSVKRLHKGVPMDAENCPIAQTISHGHKEIYVTIYKHVHVLPIQCKYESVPDAEYLFEEEVPESVFQWLQRFDKSEYPDLIGTE